jgi:hypothetical protein
MNRKDYMSENRDLLKGVMNRLNKIPQDVLYDAVAEAFTTAVELTHQDSGNAAWHWTITGLRQVEAADTRLNFMQRYGQSPIGNRRDLGANTEAVNSNTISHGLGVLYKMVYQDKRKAIAIVNTINPENYRINAEVSNPVEVTRAAHEAARMAVAKGLYAESKGARK